MSLIDKTYFVGELNIPNTNKPDVEERLTWFIEKHERPFLEQLLGVKLYQAFVNGLIAPTVDQRWTDLIQGKVYTNRAGQQARWKGLVPSADHSLILDVASSTDIVVGRGSNAYDPIVNSTSVTIPPSIVGKPFQFEQRGFGQLRKDEYTVVGNVLTLLNGWKFDSGNTYFYNVYSIGISGTPGIVKESIIANYIYFHWMQDKVSNTVGIGEVKTKAENAEVFTPKVKMITAWNELSQEVVSLMDFIQSNRSDYSEWESFMYSRTLNYFRPINLFGI